MDFEECKKKALNLPLLPGVYIMRDKSGVVIYVGKAKKLKNRVSQYFQDTASHTPKTRLMVSKIHDFDVIVAGSEFEALILECSLIKQHMPRYNILLKDDKGYPYVRLDEKEAYPRLTMVNKPADDGALYFGPFGSRGTTKELLDAITVILNLPSCNRKFPRDIGKGRPCLHHHMNQCAGWCTGKEDHASYRARIEQAKHLLQGNFKTVTDAIRSEMLEAADAMRFELAASLRDRLTAVENLGQKQLVTAGKHIDTDVVGYGEIADRACFVLLHYADGKLVSKDYQLFVQEESSACAVTTLLEQYYLSRDVFPREILLPFSLQDSTPLCEYVLQKSGKKLKLLIPSRGDKKKLVQLACENAVQEVQRASDKETQHLGTLNLLGRMLSVDLPRRMESFDISNLGNTDIVAGMVVFEDGRPKPSAYKKFKIQGLSQADDYESMFQAVMRRFLRYTNGDAGFAELPDLLLIDGGALHAGVVRKALDQLQISIPVFGMVKDDRHRTRALVSPEGQEIRIDNHPAVFSLIGNIQEETHRFAIGYQKSLRSKRIRHSQLDDIPGIGQVRKQQLLKHFKSITAISNATLPELERLLPKPAALAVYRHFSQKED